MLEDVRKALVGEQKQVAVITSFIRDWPFAHDYVRRELGKPAEESPNRWVYADGRTIRFYSLQDANIDYHRGNPRPIRGFDGAVAWFGPAECDELLGVRR